jgi:RNA polymerase sigma factor (TIGR02999 family)
VEVGRGGGADAARLLLPQVYQQLRGIAEAYFRRAGRHQTLQPTALVHEAFLRMADRPDAQWNGRSHFCAVCATAMRAILVDHARARTARKRGGDWQRLTLDAAHIVPHGSEWAEVDILALNRALERLEQLNPRHAHIIELRFFGGMTVEQIAEHLGLSRTTIENDWRTARAWLSAQLSDGEHE